MNSKSLFKWHHFASDIILWGGRSFLPLSAQPLSVVRDDVRAGNGSRPQYAVPLGPEVCARNRISGKENRTSVRFNKNLDVKLHPEQAKTALEQWSNAPESKQQTKAASRLAKQLPQFLGLLEAAIREYKVGYVCKLENFVYLEMPQTLILLLVHWAVRCLMFQMAKQEDFLPYAWVSLALSKYLVVLFHSFSKYSLEK